MQQRTLTAQRLTALFLLGWLLFNYPLLSLFNDSGTWFGVPRLYAYLFLAWALFIGLLALIAERDARRQPGPPLGSPLGAPQAESRPAPDQH